MKQKDIFYIVISSFIVIVLWVGFNLWHIQNVSKLSQAVLLQSLPISPSFDTKTLQQLKNRTPVVPVFTTKQAASQSAVMPKPTIQPTIIVIPTEALVFPESTPNPTP